jgi:hypothetical protein
VPTLVNMILMQLELAGLIDPSQVPPLSDTHCLRQRGAWCGRA